MHQDSFLELMVNVNFIQELLGFFNLEFDLMNLELITSTKLIYHLIFPLLIYKQ